MTRNRSDPVEISDAQQPAVRGANSRRQNAAVALAPALEPLVDVCLALAITSPEMERLVRAVFVDRAAALLNKTHGKKKAANDLRIGLMIGVHRNFVKQIRSTKPRVQLAKVGHRHLGAALLEGWATDWQYLNTAGQPRDLPIQASEGGPSFEALVRKYMGGVPPRTAIAELRRSGAIRLLPDEMVRLRSRNPQPFGVTAGNVAAVSERLRELSSTLLHNLRTPDDQRFCEGTDGLQINPQRLAAIRQIIARRSRNFLDTIAAELGDESVTPDTSDQIVKIGVAVFAHEKDDS